MDITNRFELKPEEKPKKLDIYRDTPLRYLGYSNEIGEAFRSMIGPRWVAATYGLATVYVVADTADKTYETYTTNKLGPDLFKKTAFTATDSFLWQVLASVVIPGFTINRVCAAANFLLKKRKNLAVNRRNWIVTALGLSAIPFIIKPIDNFTDKLLDGTLRKIKPK